MTYSLLHDLVSPDKPSAKSLDFLSGMHYEPNKVIVDERFHFHQQRSAGDNTAECVAELRMLATNVNLESTSIKLGEIDFLWFE